ncbi:ABC transporter, permease protein [Bacillus cereus AH1273]|nr:ABC transporter, permease protein [Bacillus cereus AH1273]
MKRSAIAPPRGDSKKGILVTAYSPANISARPVISNTYKDRAKRKSVEPKIVIICPLTIK